MKEKEGKEIIQEILEKEPEKPEEELEKPEEPKISEKKPDEQKDKKEVSKAASKKPVKPVIVKPVKIKKEKVVKSKKKKAKKKSVPDDDYEDDSTFSKVIIFAGIVCILLLLILVKVFTAQVPVDNKHNLTDVTGTVTMEAYLDYSCEYSSDAWNELLNLKGIYGKNLDIKIVNFPMSAEDVVIGNAVQCARAQKKHMSFINRILSEENLDAEKLKKLGWAEGLDINQFYECIDSMQYKENVKKDFVAAYEKGVRASPTFFIDDKMITGLQTPEFFENIIDKKLGIN